PVFEADQRVNVIGLGAERVPCPVAVEEYAIADLVRRWGSASSGVVARPGREVLVVEDLHARSIRPRVRLETDLDGHRLQAVETEDVRVTFVAPGDTLIR